MWGEKIACGILNTSQPSRFVPFASFGFQNWKQDLVPVNGGISVSVSRQTQNAVWQSSCDVWQSFVPCFSCLNKVLKEAVLRWLFLSRCANFTMTTQHEQVEKTTKQKRRSTIDAPTSPTLVFSNCRARAHTCIFTLIPLHTHKHTQSLQHISEHPNLTFWLPSFRWGMAPPIVCFPPRFSACGFRVAGWRCLNGRQGQGVFVGMLRRPRREKTNDGETKS